MQIICLKCGLFAYFVINYMQITHLGGQIMRKFDYTFLKDLYVPTSFLGLTNKIYELRSVEEEKKRMYPDMFTSLQKIAVVQSVKGSNAIEGIITTDKRIEEIVNQSSAPLNHSEREIAGYRDALNMIHEGYEDLSLSEETALGLHTVLLSQTGLEDGGKYKVEDNAIYERFADGSMQIRWNPVSAKETPAAMKQLFYAYSAARNDAGIDQLLLIPCFVLDFLCIHPFSDGNGRMSRLLSLLLLYKNRFDISKYISFEEQINLMKGEYYEALKSSSYGWHENSNDYIPFMENFLLSLYLCYKELDKRFLTLGSKKVNKRERVENALMNAFIPISKKEICRLFPDISVTTVETVISSLLKEGRIKKIGTTRDARYIKT